jgi:hypothetical protein
MLGWAFTQYHYIKAVQKGTVQGLRLDLEITTLCSVSWQFSTFVCTQYIPEEVPGVYFLEIQGVWGGIGGIPNKNKYF